MKLAVLGATGGTGKLVVEYSLAAGYGLVVLARDPGKLVAVRERMTVVRGDVTDPAAGDRAVSGADAVISVLGSRRKTKGKPITEGTQNSLDSMKKYGVRRIVLTSTPSADDPEDSPDLRLKLAIALIQLTARSAEEDIIETARAVRASDRDWTMVRVSILSDGPKTGDVRTGNVSREMGMSINRANLG